MMNKHDKKFIEEEIYKLCKSKKKQSDYIKGQLKAYRQMLKLNNISKFSKKKIPVDGYVILQEDTPIEIDISCPVCKEESTFKYNDFEVKCTKCTNGRYKDKLYLYKIANCVKKPRGILETTSGIFYFQTASINFIRTRKKANELVKEKNERSISIIKDRFINTYNEKEWNKIKKELKL